MGTDKLTVDGLHHTVDAWVVRKEKSATVLLTNHALPTHPIKTENVRIKLENVPDYSSAWVERVDEAHANPKKLWVSMGEPEYLSVAQRRSRSWKKLRI